MELRVLPVIFLVFTLAAFCVIAEDPDDFDEATVEVESEQPTIDVAYESPVPADKSKVYFAEHFDDQANFDKNWIKSSAKKEGISEDIAKYDGEWKLEPPQRDGLNGDKGLVLKSKAKHSAISAKLSKPFHFNTRPLIVQYEVLLQEGQECGGAYLKLLSDSADTKNLAQFHDKSPYTIMFGPDKCGNDHKLHFIFRHKNPMNGSVEEKHCKRPKERIEDAFSDKLPHLYTLIVRPDNTYQVSLDRKVINSGSLLDDFTPPVNPPAEIDDPNDKKPEDWDEQEKIPDPEAVKPEDWDEDAPAQIVDESAVMPDGWLENEPTHIPDPNAQRPEDWDVEMDGEWEPPLIDNPACAGAVGCGPWERPLINNPDYKGKWRAPLIDNPNYKGKWKPRRIPNPDYFEDKNPFKMHSVSAVGFELWTMSKDILFDNIIITEEETIAEQWAVDTFDKKRQKIAKDSASLWGRMLKAMNYRPKSWALYFVYCCIPIVVYVSYLWKCMTEESVIQKLANVTNDYPILWALYIVILSIPVILVLYLCCRPSSSAKDQTQDKEDVGHKKKTDEATEDDVEFEEDQEGEEDKEKYSDKEEDNENENEEVEETEEVVEQEPVTQKSGDEQPKRRKPRKE